MIAADFLADPCRLTLFCAGSAAYGAPIVHSPAPAPVRPTSQYVRLFSGLRRSTSREYLVLLADDQMPDTARPSMGPPPRRNVATLLDVGTVVYGEGHSRPAQPHSTPSTAAGENAPRQDIPLDWVRGVCPIR